jgi:hypothetical protein
MMYFANIFGLAIVLFDSFLECCVP